MTGKVIGYARVSTTEQNLGVQLEALKHCDKVFQEKVSGTKGKDNRPELAKLLEYVREGDVVVITKLDRLARSVLHLNSIAELLKEKGVDLKVLDQQIDTTTSAGKLMFNMLAAVAEFETDIRKERQLAGIALAKEEGRYTGRKRVIDRDKVKELRGQGLSMDKIAAELGVSKSAVHKILSQL